jgi:hypothetical protein
MLATAGEHPHVIPISAPVRAGGHMILLSLRQSRGSLARLRSNPAVALLVLAEDNTAFTAHGTARVVEETMTAAPDYAAVRIDVTSIDDHRQDEFRVSGGVDREWVNQDEQHKLRERVEALNEWSRRGNN